MAEEHVLREGYDPKQRADEVTIALADAIFHKHGNYPAALIDACTAIVAIHGEKIASDLVEVIYRDKAEEATSPF